MDRCNARYIDDENDDGYTMEVKHIVQDEERTRTVEEELP